MNINNILKKVLAFWLIVFVVFSSISLFANEQADTRVFDIGKHNHIIPTTYQEYVELLAYQMAEYNKIAPYLWYNNALINVHVLAGSNNNRNLLWFIEPDGNITELTREEAEYLRPYMDFSDDAWFWDFTYMRCFKMN